MLIEESVYINANVATVWETFIDLTRWKYWNSVLTDVSPGTDRITQGGKLSVYIRPFSFPLRFEARITDVIPRGKVVWSGSKYGIFSRHEFVFETQQDKVCVTSRETFSGLPLLIAPRSFPDGKIRDLTLLLLKELKQAVETDVSSRKTNA